MSLPSILYDGYLQCLLDLVFRQVSPCGFRLIDVSQIKMKGRCICEKTADTIVFQWFILSGLIVQVHWFIIDEMNAYSLFTLDAFVDRRLLYGSSSQNSLRYTICQEQACVGTYDPTSSIFFRFTGWHGH